MNNEHHKNELLALLHAPLLTEQQLKRIITNAMATKPKPPTSKWYVSLWRICWDAVSMVVCGTALGLVFVVIAHYIGLEAWINSTHHH